MDDYTQTIQTKIAGDGSGWKCESREMKFSDSKEWKEVFERFGERLKYAQGPVRINMYSRESESVLSGT